MNPTSKKFIALFLAFSLMMLSANLYAKERRGAKLLITKKDGQQISGELITVKPNSLLLLDTEGKDVSVDIADIEVITIVKKSKLWTGAGLGFLICGGGTALYHEIFFKENHETSNKHVYTAIYGFIAGAVGLLFGGITGKLVGTDEIIHFEGMSDSEINEVLEKLRKKARIRDYK